MSFTSFVKALFIPAIAGAALAAPLLGSTPASAATCQPDPLNGVCVATTNYTVKTTATKVAVQRLPQTGSVLTNVAKGATVAVICKLTNTGGTWDAISGGG